VVPAAGKRFLNKSNLFKAITGLDLGLQTRAIRASWVALRSYLSVPRRRAGRKQLKHHHDDDDNSDDDDNHKTQLNGPVLTRNSNSACDEVDNETVVGSQVSSDASSGVNDFSGSSMMHTMDLMTHNSSQQTIFSDDHDDVHAHVHVDDETTGDDSVLNLDFLLGTY